MDIGKALGIGAIGLVGLSVARAMRQKFVSHKGKGDKLPTGEVVPVDLPHIKPVRKWTAKDAQDAVAEIAEKYGHAIARVLEATWRLETAHFKSGEYKITGDAGLHPFAPRFPWRSRKSIIGQIWTERREWAPIGYTYLTERFTGKRRVYLVFPHPRAFAHTFAELVKRIMERRHCSPEEAAAIWLGRWGSELWRRRLAYLRRAKTYWV